MLLIRSIQPILNDMLWVGKVCRKYCGSFQVRVLTAWISHLWNYLEQQQEALTSNWIFLVLSLPSRGFSTLLQSPHGLMFRAGCSGPSSRTVSSAAPLTLTCPSCFAVSALLLDLELIWCYCKASPLGFQTFWSHTPMRKMLLSTYLHYHTL